MRPSRARFLSEPESSNHFTDCCSPTPCDWATPNRILLDLDPMLLRDFSALVPRIVVGTFNSLNLSYPATDAKRQQDLRLIRKQLMTEGPDSH